MSRALSVDARKAFLLLATGLTSAAVAASVRSFVVSEQPVMAERFAVYEQVALSDQPASVATPEVLPAFDRSALFMPSTDMAAWAEAPSSTTKEAVETPYISYGRASYYGHKSRTARGETTDVADLTAAHPTLPFGTRVRVTNLFTGKSVTVRINDRGPFVRGRIVDLSYSAAEQLGIVGRGVAHVRLEVVE